MPDRRFKVEGTVTIQFEAELSASDLDCFAGDDDYERAIEDFIEGDPAEFLTNHRGIEYREDDVRITSCYEMEPDWDGELKKVITKAKADTLREIVGRLPNDAKKAIVEAIKNQDEDE
ncbi:MAG: hypothetical protein ACYTGV_16570 [Planctomycetota bacterium]|jgi:hypothetical protein